MGFMVIAETIIQGSRNPDVIKRIIEVCTFGNCAARLVRCLGVENFDMCWYVDAESELTERLVAIPVLTSFSSQPSTIMIQIVTSVARISSNLVVRVLSYSPSCTP